MTEAGLRAVRRIADQTGMFITMHVNESPFDNISAQERFGRPTIPMLAHTGLLGPDFLAVHCVHMTDEDIELFVEHGVSVAYNAVSNMYLGSGIAPIAEMEAAGLTIGLATDGSGSNNCQDMLETLKFSALLQKVAPRTRASSPPSMRWIGPPAAARRAWPGRPRRLAGAGQEGRFLPAEPLHPEGDPGSRPGGDARLFGRPGQRGDGGGGRPSAHGGRRLQTPRRGGAAAGSPGGRAAAAQRAGTERLLENRARWRPV